MSSYATTASCYSQPLTSTAGVSRHLGILMAPPVNEGAGSIPLPALIPTGHCAAKFVSYDDVARVLAPFRVPHRLELLLLCAYQQAFVQHSHRNARTPSAITSRLELPPWLGKAYAPNLTHLEVLGAVNFLKASTCALDSPLVLPPATASAARTVVAYVLGKLGVSHILLTRIDRSTSAVAGISRVVLTTALADARDGTLAHYSILGSSPPFFHPWRAHAATMLQATLDEWWRLRVAHKAIKSKH